MTTTKLKFKKKIAKQIQLTIRYFFNIFQEYTKYWSPVELPQTNIKPIGYKNAICYPTDGLKTYIKATIVLY